MQVGFRLCLATIWCVLVAGPLLAQMDRPTFPVSVDVLVLPASGDPLQVAPIATRNTVIGNVNPQTGAITPNAQCGRTALPVSTPPLVNPTTTEFDDPFAAGKKCVAALPTGLPDGAGYRAVVVAVAPSCQPVLNGPVLSPCPSGRSQVGVPPFSIVSIRTAPAVLTGLAIKP